MNQFNLVIFDCDGVLIDSERIANTILLEMLKEIGLFLTLEDVFDIFVGTSTTRCLEIVKNLLGKSPPENFATEFEQRTMQAFMTDLHPVQGIHDVLIKLNLSYCVASNIGLIFDF
ncbi:HAD family hydrolase [Nostoc sphaeroides]|uniref:Haloacid dehalogenase n=1 Tax=Nostoc sphaeroides CCNUC1 TaxID=2653204 RepID=A0A5P8WBT9_9NOSO|nr:HAD hydrolase-like protein [Nostoc sphaeroides]QFS50011.1 haloacid dehalogenase [Nostoc sphaeroides CCNUC1]